ncbi:sugar transferase [Gephyromycinifex aptenodytis]|uniref:sugar transferase n=1 Tax=Gephyromycinifex aptenodytis TaxID=2716227 RepID=UPI001D0223D4|nr:sugar transferase [Gephyromycinifex aptenodytis]
MTVLNPHRTKTHTPKTRLGTRRSEPRHRLELPPVADPLAPRLHVPPREGERVAPWNRRYLRRMVALDALSGLVAALSAAVLKFQFDLKFGYDLMTLAFPLLWVLALSLGGAYERRNLGQPGGEEYRGVGRGSVLMLALLAIIALTLSAQLSRIFVGTGILLAAIGSLLVRKTLRTWVARRRRQGLMAQRVVVVGRVDAAAGVIRSIKDDIDQGLVPVAVCASGLDGPWSQAPSIEGVPMAGEPGDAVAVVDLMEAEAVIVASHPDLSGHALRRLAWALDERQVDLLVSPGLLDVAGPRMSIRPSTNLALLHIERPASTRRAVLLKTAMDRVAAVLLLLGLSPVFFVVAVAIWLDDRGPVFYRQRRVGVRGEFFDMYKFRSMRQGADKMLADLIARNEGNEVLFKMKNDPRITRVGAFLRRYSIDELPQLLNVLRGEMSLVGPRPPLAREVEEYEPDAIRRLHAVPGMTGLWQVSGRSDLSWDESLRLDLRYVDNWSPMLDLWILVRTVRAVLGRSGAY